MLMLSMKGVPLILTVWHTILPLKTRHKFGAVGSFRNRIRHIFF